MTACLAFALLAAVMSIVSDSSRSENSWNASPAYAHFSATTSSTIPPDERVCTVTFRLLTEVVIGSIQFEAKYGRNVRFVGDGTDVQCEPLAGEFWVFSDSGERIERKTKLRAGMVDSQGVFGPADLLACRLRFSDTPPTDDDVKTPVVTEATGTDAMVLHPFPELDVRFDCPMGTTTTNTTTTTQTTTTTVMTGTPRCGHPVDRCGLLPSATDALVVLRTAVGTVVGIECPLCRCDMDGSGRISATDALSVLRLAVRIFAPAVCPPGLECENDLLPEACPDDSLVSDFPLE